MALHLWQLWCIIGILFFLVEIFTPAMFFLNLGLACFIAAIGAAFSITLFYQVLIFAVFSAIFLFWLRPILIKTKQCKDTGFDSKYIGEKAHVVETINADGGRVSIYGEEWQAKSIDGTVIEKDSQVKIVKNESIMMFVEKI